MEGREELIGRDMGELPRLGSGQNFAEKYLPPNY
jgi:hypothetical protein